MEVAIIIYLAIVILLIVSLWKIYLKANKPGWACLIPIYNIIVLLEIIGKPWWWLLLFLIPITSVPLKVVVTEQVRSIINWDYCWRSAKEFI